MNTRIVAPTELEGTVGLFNERPWTKQGTWPGSFLWFEAILESFSTEWTGRVLNPHLAIRDYACIGQPHGAYDCLIGSKCFDEIRAVIEEAYTQSGPAYFREYAKLCQKKCDEWLQFARTIAERTDIDQLSNQELADLISQYFVHLGENGAFMDTIIVLADVLGDVVGSSIDALLMSNRIDFPGAYGSFLDVHSEPPLPTNVILANTSLREMANQVRTSPHLQELFNAEDPAAIAASLEQTDDELYDALRNHASRFAWLSTYSFTGQLSTIEDIIQSVQERLDELDEAEEHQTEHLANELVDRLREIKLPPGLHELLGATRSLTYINTFKDDVHQISWQEIQPLVEQSALRLRCSVADLTLLSPHEIETALRESHLERELLALRAEGWALLKADHTIHVVQGEQDLDRFRSGIKAILPIDVAILVGTPVFPGRVRGQARLVLTSNDCDKVQTGDILVATNTSPDFLPAMHRAAAFVTDTGNLICHAVIAAREFRKVCVISTQIATQLLTDGEWVEVGGTTGTVTRLDVSSNA